MRFTLPGKQLYLDFGYPPEYLTTEDIMLPFYAYLAKGARFIPEPLARNRVHPLNASLSLEWERSTTIERPRVEAEMYSVHLAHCLEMSAELERRRLADSARFDDVAHRIRPLLAHQMNPYGKAARRRSHQTGQNGCEPADPPWRYDLQSGEGSLDADALLLLCLGALEQVERHVPDGGEIGRAAAFADAALVFAVGDRGPLAWARYLRVLEELFDVDVPPPMHRGFANGRHSNRRIVHPGVRLS
jgi:hypothetical protein